MGLTQVLLIGFVVLFTAFAAYWDARTHRLPNVFTVPVFVCGLMFHIISGGLVAGWVGAGNGLLFSLGGFAFGFAIMFVLWAMTGGGKGGDVKMMGAIGAWLGFKLTLLVFVTSAVLILLGALGFGFVRLTTRGVTSLRKSTQSSGVVPFGVPLALATWLVLGFGVIQQLYGG